MEPTPFEKKTWDLQDRLTKEYHKLKEENNKLKEEIASLKAQMNEKDARILEAKCTQKN